MMATSLEDLDLDAVQKVVEEYYSLQGTNTSSPVHGSGDFVQGKLFSIGRGYVQGSQFSRGRGLGSFFKKIVKATIPLVKKAGVAMAPIAKQTGQYMLERGTDVAIDTATDVLKGDSFNTALSRNAEMAMDDAAYDAARKLQSLKRGYPGNIQDVKRKASKVTQKQKRKNRFLNHRA